MGKDQDKQEFYGMVPGQSSDWEGAPPSFLRSEARTTKRGRLVMATLVSGLFALFFVGLCGWFIFQHFQERSKFDRDALAKPVVIEGNGGFADEDDKQWLTVNGTTVYLTQPFYYGLLNDVQPQASATAVYIKAAYLPYSHQAVAAQILDRAGGTLLAQYSEVPDPKEGYKAALYDRYDLMPVILLSALSLVLIIVSIWVGVLIYRRY